MIVSQIISNTNKPLFRSLMSYCVSRKYSLHFKKYCKQESAYYFIHRRRLRTSAKSNQLKELHVTPDENSKINSVVHDGKQSDMYYLPISNYVRNFYQTPLSDLVCIYDIVRKEFDKKCLSIEYEKLDKIRCTINITWPSTKSFSCIATRKVTAAHFAALKCLDWLYIYKRIKGRKPLLYDNKEIHNLLQAQKSIDINIKSELKNEIELLINKFDNEVKPLLTPCTIEDSMFPEESLRNINEHNAQSRSEELKKKLSERPNKTEYLPIDNHREEILSCLQNNSVVLIKGDTGCGKSTQVPQIIFDAYSKENRGHECNIVVSEPRRVSAVSLAQRVAYERNEILGDVVGFHVRFSHVQPKATGSILYCTTGVLLRTLQDENNLKGISHVIIDEAHERSLQTDLLLKLLKDIVKHNPHMKLIIMSATINAESFQQYFSCPIVSIPGRLHPVKMHFLEDIPCAKLSAEHNDLMHEQLPYQEIANLIVWIVKHKPPGAILCFLPGWYEIKTLHALLRGTEANMLVMALHSKISNANQQKVFEITPANVTKVILSTDIAESGITIKDITYVIDTALKRDVIWDADKGISRLHLSQVSHASILQRKGRAGRVRPGESYHFITKEEYTKLNLYPTAEILKIPLEMAVITSKLFSKEKAHVFFSDMPQPPCDRSLKTAIEILKKANILDADENLTTLGKRVSLFTLSYKLSKAIILSAIFECLQPISLIATLFSNEVRINSLSGTETIEDEVLKQLHSSLHSTSDHINAMKNYKSLLHPTDITNLDKLNNGCHQNMSIQNLKRLYKLHMETLTKSNFLSLWTDSDVGNKYANCNELVRAVLFASTNQLLKRNMYGFKRRCFTRHANTINDENDAIVRIDTSSVNYNRRFWPCDILTYIHKMEYVTRNSCAVFDTSIISPLSVLLFSRDEVQCEKIRKGDIKDKNILIRIKDIQNLNFCCDRETAGQLLKLRDVLWNIVDFIIEYGGTGKQEKNLNLVHAYKRDLLCLLSKMLEESAKDIDEEEDINN